MDTLHNQQQQQPGISGGKGKVREGAECDEREDDGSREKVKVTRK